VLLFVLLSDPLWLKKAFTTKEHKGFHEGTERENVNTGQTVQKSTEEIFVDQKEYNS
jgi:hypothetical protein